MPHRGWGYKVDLLLLPVLPTSPGAEHLAAPSAQEFWSAAYFLSPTLHLPNDFVSSAISLSVNSILSYLELLSVVCSQKFWMIHSYFKIYPLLHCSFSLSLSLFLFLPIDLHKHTMAIRKKIKAKRKSFKNRIQQEVTSIHKVHVTHFHAFCLGESTLESKLPRSQSEDRNKICIQFCVHRKRKTKHKLVAPGSHAWPDTKEQFLPWILLQHRMRKRTSPCTISPHQIH